ncbi:nitroreductase [Clostridium carboxidivorans P7]|uniref:Nitroreductase n=1 Tax=Clostridium carboxidivorans P7 TaxID=536227 RepID=C6Q036_9CLOT|nr:SagB/ThcOx family dehydrogenase [Clostridium carboxidivorans]AKN33890.1 nitroreductase [Clostridium carboxidivorans P7]EET85147.1 nitroreductase [Clostridium carboxidivorans P7]EFG86490.1 SagB-type dehydrogenase domain protein [Clostridium carboxidivorans P7]
MNKEVLKDFLKANVFKELDNIKTDQEKELAQPAVQKSSSSSIPLIDLVSIQDINLGETSVFEALKHRKTRRVFSNQPLSLEELSFLLWSVQGVKKIVNKGYATLRTVPSAGARHSFETYIAVSKVEGLEKGIYRYLPLEHKLSFLFSVEDLQGKLDEAVFNQRFVGKSAVTFIWTTIPYRMEWRYDIASPKLIALDAGHVCENLYLSAECINSGVCAVAAYDQEKIDELINVDGNEEFTIYLAAVGKAE